MFAIAAAALGAAFLAAAFYLAISAAITGNVDLDGEIVTTGELGRLSPGELADAGAGASSAFVRAPLDATNVIALSRIAEVEGKAEASERLKLAAGEMIRRDTGVQVEALTIFLERGDYDQVMYSLDGLTRSQPDEAENFFALAAEISDDEDGSKAVARVLATDPPWRPQFFAYLISKGQPQVASRIMNDIRGLSAPVQDSELAGVINYYIQAGDFDQAYAAWLSSLSEEELKDVKRIYDGGFRHPVRGLRFDWTVRPADGLAYRQFPRNTASIDQTLQLEFQDFAGGVSHLSQILRLRPGRYRLSGEVRFEGFASPTGLVFRLYCLDGGSPKALDETAPLPQSTQWISFDKSFEVPSEKCVNQILQLESKTRLLNSQVTRGMIAIDAVAIDSLPALAP